MKAYGLSRGSVWYVSKKRMDASQGRVLSKEGTGRNPKAPKQATASRRPPVCPEGADWINRDDRDEQLGFACLLVCPLDLDALKGLEQASEFDVLPAG